LSPEALEALSPATRAVAEEDLKATNERRIFTVSPVLFQKMMAFERKWVKAGGLLAAGVDPWGNGSLPGFGAHRNYEVLVEAGFTPVEAIKIVSANGAAVLRMIDETGTITVGKRADLVVLDGDPVARPAEIGKVRWTFRDGIGYDAAKLRASVKGMVGIQ
jgi:Amidohydrolase family